MNARPEQYLENRPIEGRVFDVRNLAWSALLATDESALGRAVLDRRQALAAQLSGGPDDDPRGTISTFANFV